MKLKLVVKPDSVQAFGNAWFLHRTAVLCCDLAPKVGLPVKPELGRVAEVDVRSRPFNGAHRVEATWSPRWREARWILPSGESLLAYTAVHRVLKRLGLKRYVYVKVVK